MAALERAPLTGIQRASAYDAAEVSTSSFTPVVLGSGPSVEISIPSDESIVFLGWEYSSKGTGGSPAIGGVAFNGSMLSDTVQTTVANGYLVLRPYFDAYETGLITVGTDSLTAMLAVVPGTFTPGDYTVDLRHRTSGVGPVYFRHRRLIVVVI